MTETKTRPDDMVSTCLAACHDSTKPEKVEVEGLLLRVLSSVQISVFGSGRCFECSVHVSAGVFTGKNGGAIRGALHDGLAMGLVRR